MVYTILLISVVQIDLGFGLMPFPLIMKLDIRHRVS
jgi:hypothetical protein